jgi:hypothetical protein
MLNTFPVSILHNLYYVLFFHRMLVFCFGDKWLSAPVGTRGRASAPAPVNNILEE